MPLSGKTRGNHPYSLCGQDFTTKGMFYGFYLLIIDIRIHLTNPLTTSHSCPIGHCRDARGLGKSMVVFRLFEKLRYSNERSTRVYTKNGSV